ncbi:MAG: hypothetical protein MUC95_07720 [Spirochaetes bacterium]|jgi:hypothetical protein|nr:hypothetical protein [Spirochaetota bacterium]
MKVFNWYIAIAAALLLFSSISYLTQIYLFHKFEDTLFYLLQDLSFVPVQVLIVTLILDRLLKKREKLALLEKMNMVIGVFFHEVGNDLIKDFTSITGNFNDISNQLKISTGWKENDFSEKIKNFQITPDRIIFNADKILKIKEFLTSRRDAILKLLANPNLLEHDTFTDLLWAVFHLSDELFHRNSFTDLPQTDIDHLKGDMVRAYKLIAYEWLSYMKHLKKDYPYLYSIAVRTNPFNPEALITVT